MNKYERSSQDLVLDYEDSRFFLAAISDDSCGLQYNLWQLELWRRELYGDTSGIKASAVYHLFPGSWRCYNQVHRASAKTSGCIWSECDLPSGRLLISFASFSNKCSHAHYRNKIFTLLLFKN